MKLMGTMEIVEGANLTIGGMDLNELAIEYKTPLYIIDEEDFENRALTFTKNFVSDKFKTKVLYASKAFTNLYMVKKVNELGLSLDVASGGELYTALKAGLDPGRIYFHGNNKLPFELEFAIDERVGAIVVDNLDEMLRIEELASMKKVKVPVLLRVNPCIEAHTHEYIQTTRENSKFGLSIYDYATISAVEFMTKSECFDFRGIHSHIGSQIFEPESFFKEADIMIEFARKLELVTGASIRDLNLGGGFGVYYTEGDKPFELGVFLKEYISHIESAIEKNGLNPETVEIEPGRSLINSSGSTLYRVGSVKTPMAGEPFILIDGGMTDNPRPSMYQAKYEAVLVNKALRKKDHVYNIAGRACETGDILIKEIALPKAVPGDLLLIPSTGAYTYSMSSNYNRIEKPAVIFVKDGKARLAVKRETYEDLVRNDVE